VLASFAGYLPTPNAQAKVPSFTGSFVKFDRNFTTQMWQQELAAQAALGHKILILSGDGTLMPSTTDSTGFVVNPNTLIYPSSIFPAVPPQPDDLGTLLTVADQFGMQVYVGSLQTYDLWSNGDEFDALHKYDPIVAREIITLYGSHPSLNSGRNWYFGHELWLNWVKFYGPGYYGINELMTYEEQMKALNPHSRVIEAPVFKRTGAGLMPGLSPQDAGTYLDVLTSQSHVDIVAPQDGAGAQDGAPAVSELGSYYSEMYSALAPSIASGSVQLWTTAETYQAALAGTESANDWQPAPLSRIQQQLAAEAPFVSQTIEYTYGWDMSPEATYTPVEADTLRAQYSKDPSGTTPLTGGAVSYSIAPSSTYADTVPSKLTNGMGGGFGQVLNNDWVGFASAPTGVVTVTVDLGAPKTIVGVRTLFAAATNSGIYFPQNVVTEYSTDGASWFPIGNANGQNVGIASPLLFSVDWVNATNYQQVVASQVKVTINFTEWLFIGEIKVMAP